MVRKVQAIRQAKRQAKSKGNPPDHYQLGLKNI